MMSMVVIMMTRILTMEHNGDDDKGG
jgi:hypothetical protein